MNEKRNKINIKLVYRFTIIVLSRDRIIITHTGVGGIAKGTAQSVYNISPKLIFDSRVCGLFTQSGSIYTYNCRVKDD